MQRLMLVFTILLASKVVLAQPSLMHSSKEAYVCFQDKDPYVLIPFPCKMDTPSPFIMISRQEKQRADNSPSNWEQPVILDVLSDGIRAELASKFFRVRLRGVVAAPNLPHIIPGERTGLDAPNNPRQNFPILLNIHWYAFGECIKDGWPTKDADQNWYGSENGACQWSNPPQQ